MPRDIEAEKSLARDPATPSDVLERLGMEWLARWQRNFQRGLTNSARLNNDSFRYAEGQGGVEEAVTVNPNTPPHVLVELACHFPDAFARNPVAPLLPLECPDLIAALPDRKKWWAVWHEKTPASFLIALRASTSDPDMRETIDAHIAIAGEVPPATFCEELRTLLIRDARRLRGKNRKALQTLIQGGIVPAWLLPNSRANRLPEAENSEAVKEQVIRKVMDEIYYDATPVIVFLLMMSPYSIAYDHTLLRSRWGKLGWILNPRRTSEPSPWHMNSADRYIRAAVQARLRGDEVTLW